MTRCPIRVTDDNRCSNCGRPVGWTVFGLRERPDPTDPYSGVVSFLRHYPDRDTARRASSRLP